MRSGLARDNDVIRLPGGSKRDALRAIQYVLLAI